MVHRGLYTRQTGRENLWYMTVCTGHLQEAINTSAVLYHVTGREKYAKDYAEFMKYLDEVVMDHENGSWFHQLDEHNHLKGTVWPGKIRPVSCALQSTLIPYHKGRYIHCACRKKKNWKSEQKS